MKTELQDKIITNCPILFRSLNYIEAPDGWYNIISSTSKLIEQYLVSKPWTENCPAAAQIKSKFGTLRFYIDNNNSYIEGIIQLAEKLSCSTCEECGIKGDRVNLGWIFTLCLQDEQKMMAKRQDREI